MGEYTEFIKQVVYNKMKVNLSKKVPNHIIDNMNIDILSEALSGDLCFEFTTYLATQSKVDNYDKVEIESEPMTVYHNWFEMFKDQYFPQWLLDMLPVKCQVIIPTKYVTHNLKVTTIYPQVEVPSYECEHFVVHEYKGLSDDLTARNNT